MFLKLQYTLGVHGPRETINEENPRMLRTEEFSIVL
jgi:hypothetical protein